MATHFLVDPLSQELDGLPIGGMLNRFGSHIDCKVRARESIVLVLVAAEVVAADVEDSVPYRRT